MTTPNHYPFVNVTSPPAPAPPTRYRLRFGVMECMDCGYAQQFCNCAKREIATTTTAQDGAASASLDRRIKDVHAAHMAIGPTDPWVLFCGFCGQPMRECRGACMCKGR